MPKFIYLKRYIKLEDIYSLMLSLRIFLSLAFGLSINTSIASESIEGSSTVFLQDKQLIVIAGRPDERRRGCETGTPPNVWALDICRSRNCYAAADEVSLWFEKRPHRTAKVLIENLDNSDSIKLSWKASDATLDWPEKLPIKSGASYKIKIWNRTFTFEEEISLYQIPSEHKTISAKAEWMRENGCKSQAKMLPTKVKSSF